MKTYNLLAEIICKYETQQLEAALRIYDEIAKYIEEAAKIADDDGRPALAIKIRQLKN